MTTYFRLVAGIFTVALLVSGCAPIHRAALLGRTGGSGALFGQFQAYDARTGHVLSFNEVVDRCRGADVILFGEQHSDAVCNELEAQLLVALSVKPRPVALAMEFFEADTQAGLDAYLFGRLDEAAFREQTRQGRAYVLAHRPLIEFCRASHIPVLAANAPRRLVGAFRKSGLDYVEYRAGLPAADQRWLPETNQELTGPYRDRFIELMSSHGPGPASQPASAPATQPATAPAGKEGMGESPPASGKMPMPPPATPLPPREGMGEGVSPMPPVSQPASAPVSRPASAPVSQPSSVPSSQPTTNEAPTTTSAPASQPALDPARMFLSQSLWDQSMAESLVNFRTRFPAHSVMLIVGSFHVEQTGGTAQKFQQRRPKDRIVTVVYRGTTDGRFPFDPDDRDAGDVIIYGIKPPPEPEGAGPGGGGPPGPASQPAATQPTSSPATAPATQPESMPVTRPAENAPGAIDTPRSVNPAIRQPFGEREIPIRNVLAVNRVGRYGRTAVHTDAIEAQLVAGQFAAPTEGQTVALPDGSTRTWAAVTAGDDGWLRDDALKAGYAYAAVESDREQVLLLDAAGHNVAYVNGEPRGGDPYALGFVRLPVGLRAGRNDLLFLVPNGELHARLVETRGPVMIDVNDLTLPDYLIGQTEDLWGAVVVINANTRPLEHARLVARCGPQTRDTPLPSIPALAVRKVGFLIPALQTARPPPVAPLDLTLLSAEGELDRTTLELTTRQSNELHKRTFVSDIDGSVQYYAVQPMSAGTDNTGRPALFLSLHGAGVDTLNQARCYAPKTWGHVVAPTNRRPFGFDWEDWGRLDALEVLALAEKTLGTDPQRTYLTGHSMGGHGTWQVGAHFPDRFAAIAPSAGWISFWSYVGDQRPEDASPMETLLRRATNPGDTLALSRNYLHYGIYILHGSADDNVPVEQARTMRKHLADYHSDFTYYERPGAGHWWGNECVDWPPLFDFLKLHSRPAPETVSHIEFVTASPAISARCDWATIEQQIRCLDFSKIDLTLDREARTIRGTTGNVAQLTLAVGTPSQGGAAMLPPPSQGGAGGGSLLSSSSPLTIELDGDRLEDLPWPAATGEIRLARRDDHWQPLPVAPAAPDTWPKSPHRSGPFKNAFNHRVQLVYGTRGSPDENAWAFAKARYDAETFWYRGNGSFDVIPDTAFDPAAEPERNVVLYGNANTNAAWKSLLPRCPVEAASGRVGVGRRDIERNDLAVLAVYPRENSNTALVGMVGGSGLSGMRLTDRLPVFVSGVAYPDWIVLGPEVLRTGLTDILATGFLDNDWQLDAEQTAWRAP